MLITVLKNTILCTFAFGIAAEGDISTSGSYTALQSDYTESILQDTSNSIQHTENESTQVDINDQVETAMDARETSGCKFELSPKIMAATALGMGGMLLLGGPLILYCKDRPLERSNKILFSKFLEQIQPKVTKKAYGKIHDWNVNPLDLETFDLQMEKNTSEETSESEKLPNAREQPTIRKLPNPRKPKQKECKDKSDSRIKETAKSKKASETDKTFVPQLCEVYNSNLRYFTKSKRQDVNDHDINEGKKGLIRIPKMAYMDYCKSKGSDFKASQILDHFQYYNEFVNHLFAAAVENDKSDSLFRFTIFNPETRMKFVIALVGFMNPSKENKNPPKENKNPPEENENP